MSLSAPTRRGFSLSSGRLAAVAAVLVGMAWQSGCGEPVPGETGPPSIELLLPEPGMRFRRTVHFEGTTGGEVNRVEILVDELPPILADGRKRWSATRTLDESRQTVEIPFLDLEDGSHVVRARAVGGGDQTAESAPISFITLRDAAPGTSILGGAVRNQENNPIPGATISTVEHPADTTLSDLTGRYALTGLDPALTYVPHAKAPGYADTYWFRTGVAQDRFDADLPLFTQALIEYIAAEYGVALEEGKGTVIGFVLAGDGTGGFPGATVELSPAPPDGVFYIGPGNVFDPQLTETTTQGSFVAFNLSPGPVEMTATAGTAGFFTAGSHVGDESVSFVLGVKAP